MKKIILTSAVALSLLFTSCEKDEVTLDQQGVSDLEITKTESTITEKTADPFIIWPWLNDFKKSTTGNFSFGGSIIERYFYHNRVVFLINSCVGCPDAQIEIFDTEGNVICTQGGVFGGNIGCEDFATNATDKLTLWDSKRGY